jgi:hypothetical protein
MTEVQGWFLVVEAGLIALVMLLGSGVFKR